MSSCDLLVGISGMRGHRKNISGRSMLILRIFNNQYNTGSDQSQHMPKPIKSNASHKHPLGPHVETQLNFSLEQLGWSQMP